MHLSLFLVFEDVCRCEYAGGCHTFFSYHCHVSSFSVVKDAVLRSMIIADIDASVLDWRIIV